MLRRTVLAAAAALVLMVPTTALARDDRYPIPDGFRGFSGTLEGVVVAKDARSFRLLVRDVVNTWDKNTADDPESVIGKQVVIHARWVERDDGKVYAAEPHVRFIRTLRARERVRVEVAYDEETRRLHILELDGEQRERAGIRERDGERREKERDKKRERDGDKKRDGEREKDGEKKRDAEREKDGEKKRDPEREKDGEKKRDAERERDGEKKRDAEREREPEKKDGDGRRR